MQVQNSHNLEVVKHPYTAGYLGYCDLCSDPDWAEEGVWVGQVQFEGDTEDDVRDFHADHVSEVA